MKCLETIAIVLAHRLVVVAIIAALQTDIIVVDRPRVVIAPVVIITAIAPQLPVAMNTMNENAIVRLLAVFVGHRLTMVIRQPVVATRTRTQPPRRAVMMMPTPTAMIAREEPQVHPVVMLVAMESGIDTGKSSSLHLTQRKMCMLGTAAYHPRDPIRHSINYYRPVYHEVVRSGRRNWNLGDLFARAGSERQPRTLANATRVKSGGGYCIVSHPGCTNSLFPVVLHALVLKMCKSCDCP